MDRILEAALGTVKLHIQEEVVGGVRRNAIAAHFDNEETDPFSRCY